MALDTVFHSRDEEVGGLFTCESLSVTLQAIHRAMGGMVEAAELQCDLRHFDGGDFGKLAGLVFPRMTFQARTPQEIFFGGSDF